MPGPNVTGSITNLDPENDPDNTSPIPDSTVYFSSTASITNNESVLVIVTIRARVYEFDASAPAGTDPWGDPIAVTPVTQYSTIILQPGQTVDLSCGETSPSLMAGIPYKVESLLQAGFVDVNGDITNTKNLDFESHTFFTTGS